MKYSEKMSKLIIILFFCVLETIHAVETEDVGNVSKKMKMLSTEAETSQELRNTDLQSVESLAEIERNDVLPLIIFINAIEHKYHSQMPEKLLKLKLNAGKIAYGTEFVPRKQADQTLLCSRENVAEKCLVRQSFEESKQLRCSSEPIPEWNNTLIKCGEGNRGTIFESIYKICETDGHQFDPNDVSFYQICYDTISHKILYTSHEIMSPGLLDLNLLIHERSVNYPIVISDGPFFGDHPIKNDVLTVEETSWKKSYQMQEFVPPGDMAFATWRKTTFNNLNYEWQHKKLIGFWDEISANIRSAVKKYITNGELKFHVNTAIVDINSTSKDDEQLSNIWIKMVYILKSTITGSIPTHGVAILMNNFLYDSKTSDLKKEAITKYCDRDLCIDELTSKFNEIGGGIRCCLMTPEILHVFEYEIDGEIEELRIPNVTITEDQETLHDPITPEQAGESLRHIQPSEMLPLIMLFNLNNNRRLLFPTIIDKIETKNKRIVQGSQFYADPKKQVLFCPKQDSDEKCLSAKEFDRFEPLQCAKKATPIARKITRPLTECGIEDSGIFHEIVYEFCSTEEEEEPNYNYYGLMFYDFCYDSYKRRNLFTQHRIRSPKLLFSNLLLREHDTQHSITTADDSVPISTSQNEGWKPEYRLQQLVPAEDMAFGLWRKTTYQRINVDWQHAKLIPLWNKINAHIRDYAFWHEARRRAEISPLQSFGYKNYYMNHDSRETYVYVRTGVFDLKYESITDPIGDQKANIWVKVVRSERENSRKEVVILMNNFLVANEDPARPPNSTANAIKEYCEQSLCLDKVEEEFENIGGRIWCCPMNSEIGKLFGGTFVYPNQVLSIRNVTK